MENTINSELAVKLAPYLKNIKTEYSTTRMGETKRYKTLTLEEALEFLPEKITKDGKEFYFSLNSDEVDDYGLDGMGEIHQIGFWYCSYSVFLKGSFQSDGGKTPLEAIEKMLEYLLDNKLLK